MSSSVLIWSRFYTGIYPRPDVGTKQSRRSLHSVSIAFYFKTNVSVLGCDPMKLEKYYGLRIVLCTYIVMCEILLVEVVDVSSAHTDLGDNSFGRVFTFVAFDLCAGYPLPRALAKEVVGFCFVVGCHLLFFLLFGMKIALGRWESLGGQGPQFHAHAACIAIFCNLLLILLLWVNVSENRIGQLGNVCWFCSSYNSLTCIIQGFVN